MIFREQSFCQGHNHPRCQQAGKDLLSKAHYPCQFFFFRNQSCEFYVQWVATAMPYDFSVWMLSWTGWHRWPRSHVIIDSHCDMKIAPFRSLQAHRVSSSCHRCLGGMVMNTYSYLSRDFSSSYLYVTCFNHWETEGFNRWVIREFMLLPAMVFPSFW